MEKPVTDLVTLFPRQPAPSLVVDLIGGGVFNLAEEKPATFTLLALYRGLHCPISRASSGNSTPSSTNSRSAGSA
jgi:hypothetical protein